MRKNETAHEADVSRPLALDLPSDEPFFICVVKEGKKEILPSLEIPKSVENRLQATGIAIGFRNWGNPDARKKVGFDEWELVNIHKGILPVPHWVMESARDQERFGRPSPEYNKEFNGRLSELQAAHDTWLLIHLYRRWPWIGRPKEGWWEYYKKLELENYGDNWYAPDYAALPLIDPATLLPHDTEDGQSTA